MTPVDGTPERLWRRLFEQSLPPELDQPPQRAVVVAPHPDDEVLAAGGLLRLLFEAGTRLEVLAVTDGGASHPGSTALTSARLVELRTAELQAALTALGVSCPVTRLGLPDGGAATLEQPVLAALRRLDLQPGDWLVAPWSLDGHPDHDAVGRAAERAGGHLLAYPVWAWHRTTPAGARLPLGRARRLPLPPQVQQAKAAALACFATQISPFGPDPADQPVLTPAFLEHFARPYEVFFR